jgi:hypothetical protein
MHTYFNQCLYIDLAPTCPHADTEGYMDRQDIFWIKNFVSMCHKPLNVIYTYLILLTGPSVDPSATNGAYVNLKIDLFYCK